MSGRARPPFRADHVGSLLRPERLAAARSDRRLGRLTDGELSAVEDEFVREAVAMQEQVGLKGITDGDFRRGDWFFDFMFALEGLEPGEDVFQVQFSGGLVFEAPAAKLTRRIASPPGGIVVDDFAFLKAATTQTAKICIPAPAMFYNLVPPDRIDASIYPDPSELWRDVGRAYRDVVDALARAGCTYLQIDDVNSANIADPSRQETWRSLGVDPASLVDAFIGLNNDSIGARPASMTAVVHMCRGNYQSQWAGRGSYEMVAERYFNESNVDGFFLEYDDERSGGFEPLRFMPRDKTVVLGLVTSKHPELEPKDELKRRIDEAAKYVPLENLCISPQCGFASTHEGNRLSEDEQRRKLEHLVDVAVEVWGGV